MNRRCGNQRGQASVELLAGLPALILAGLVALQLLATGYAASVADGAAEAGALAAAAGVGPRQAARSSMPDWARDRARVIVGPDRVEVRLSPPSPIARLADSLTVASTVAVRAK